MSNIKNKSGERTLLMSVLMSSPGPIVVGAGLFMGQSATQLADFIRRTAELMSIIISFVVYKVVHKKENFDPAKKQRLEHLANYCVGIAMIFSGAIMILIALLSTGSDSPCRSHARQQTEGLSRPPLCHGFAQATPKSKDL